MERLVISPEPFIQKCRSLAGSKCTYLEGVEGRVRLAWKNGKAADFMDWGDYIIPGIAYDMLLEALLEAGGATGMNDYYPIDDAIRQGY
jgi:hypothetical protein